MTRNDFTILRTNHTSFTVSDLDQTIGFFCDALGFELLSRAPRDPKIIQQVTGVAGAEMELLMSLARAPSPRPAAGPQCPGSSRSAGSGSPEQLDNVRAVIKPLRTITNRQFD